MNTVSVIIPVHNGETYLAATLESVIAQNYPDLEIILIDDGSVDATAKVASGYGQHVTYLYQNNHGVAGARNTGIQHAQGQYIAFLDADDLWHPDFIREMANVLDHEHSYDAVNCGWQYVDRNGEMLPQATFPKQISADEFRYKLIWNNFLAVHAVMVRKSVFEDCGYFDEKLISGEDWDLWLRIATKHSFFALGKILAYYRLHYQNESLNINRMFKNLLAVVEKVFAGGEDSQSPYLGQYARARAGCFFYYCLMNFEIDYEKEALEAFDEAAHLYPGMLKKVETYYELAFAPLRCGWRSNPSQLDLKSTEQLVHRCLQKVFSVSDPEICRLKAEATACAYFALGCITYNSLSLKMARNYFRKCLQSGTPFLRNEALFYIIKCFLPAQLHVLKRAIT